MTPVTMVKPVSQLTSCHRRQRHRFNIFLVTTAPGLIAHNKQQHARYGKVSRLAGILKGSAPAELPSFQLRAPAPIKTSSESASSEFELQSQLQSKNRDTGSHMYVYGS